MTESLGPVNASEPTILLVATGERLAPALIERLGHHGAQLELAEPADVVTTAFVVAPDVIVLAGEAARDAGEAVLVKLGQQPTTSAIPVILVAEPGLATGRLERFRHGVVSVVDRTASADEMARRIVEVTGELPERPGETQGPLETTSIDDVVALFAQSLRSGILSVSSGPGSPSAQVVLREGRPLTDAIAELVARIKPMLASGQKLSYEFHETAPARISSSELGDGSDATPTALRGVRLLVIQENAARSDRLAQELRAAGAVVAVADGSGAGLELAHDLAPDVVLVDGSGVDGWALEALRAIRRDPLLRFASLLVMDADALWKNPKRPDVGLLSAKVEALLEPDRDVAARASKQPMVGTRLEVLGPVRLLRALVKTEIGLAITITHPRVVAQMDVADGLVVGASVRAPSGGAPTAEGPAALATVLGLASGRVSIVRASSPRSATIMAPVDAAIAAADAERPAIAPSLPPPEPETRPVRSSLPSLAPGELPSLVGKLEALLSDLKAMDQEPMVVPPAAPLPSVPGPRAAAALPAPVMDQLRRRMRSSSSKLAAVTDADARAHGYVPMPGVVVAPGVPRPMPRAAAKPLAGTPTAVSPSGARVPPPGLRLPPPKPGIAAPGVAAPRAPIAASPTTRAVPPPRHITASHTVPVSSHVTTAPGIPAPSSPPPPPPPRDVAADAARARRKATLVGIPSPVRDALPRASAEPSDTAIEIGAPSPPEARTPIRTAPPPPPEPGTPIDVDAPAAREQGTPIDVPLVPARDGGTPIDVALPDDGDPDGTPIDFEVPPHSEHPTPMPPSRPGAAAPPIPPAPRPPIPKTPSASIIVDPSLAPPARPDLPITDPLVELPPVAGVPTAITQVAPEARRSGRPGWVLPVAALSMVVVTAAIGVGVMSLVRGGDAGPTVTALPVAPAVPVPAVPTAPIPPTAPPAAPTVTAPPVVASPPEETVAPPTAPATAAPVVAPPAAPTAPAPRAEGEPLEGRATDFDLAALGIAPVDAPGGRRARTRRVSALLASASRHRAQSELEDAEADYRTVLGMDAENPRATAGMSMVAGARGDDARALVFARRLVQLRNSYPNNWVFLGDAYADAGDTAAARACFERALELDPAHRDARARLAALR